MLLLTKIDVFKAKIQHSPISQNFPDFKGKKGDVEAAEDFFVKKFLAFNYASRDGDRPIHVCRINAIQVEHPRLILTRILQMINEDSRHGKKAGASKNGDARVLI